MLFSDACTDACDDCLPEFRYNRRWHNFDGDGRFIIIYTEKKPSVHRLTDKTHRRATLLTPALVSPCFIKHIQCTNVSDLAQIGSCRPSLAGLVV